MSELKKYTLFDLFYSVKIFLFYFINLHAHLYIPLFVCSAHLCRLDCFSVCVEAVLAFVFISHTIHLFVKYCLQVSIHVRRVKTAPAWCTSASVRRSTSTGRWSWSVWSPLTCCGCWRRSPSLKATWRRWELVSTRTASAQTGASFIKLKPASSRFELELEQLASCDCWVGSFLPSCR